MGFIIHFYIIFGTNLLTQGPVQIAIFCLFQCFAEKEYQTESKWNETFRRVIFGTNVIQGTWSRRQERSEEATRQGGTPAPLGVPQPSWAPRSSTGLLLLPIYIYIYPYTPKTSRSTTKPYFHCRNLLYPRDPISGPFPELRRRGNRSQRASTSTP